MSTVLRRRRTPKGAVARRQRPPNYFLVGILAIAALGAIAFVSFTKEIPFVPKYEVRGVFKSSNELHSGSPVRIAGVDVGKVSATERWRGDTTIVTMEIKGNGRPVHEDAKLRIRPRLFLEGGFYVDLNPGSPSAPELDDRDVIPLPQTTTPVQFHQILSTLDTPTRDSIRAVLRELSTALAGGGAESLGRANRHLAPALRDLAILAEAARGTEEHDLSGLLRSASRVTSALASRDVQLADLVTNLNRTSTALASQDVALSASVRELDGVLREAPPALSALDRALPPTERFTASVRPALRIAPPVLRGASELTAELDAMARPPELPALLDQARPLFRDLPPFERNLQGLLRRVKPVTDCVDQRVVPVLNSTLPDGALSTNRPAWQEFAYALVGLAGTSQSFDGNGPALRYLVGIGDQLVSTLVPGLAPLFGRTERPISGSRPKWIGPLQPSVFRPDQNCSDQPPPNLRARAEGGG